MTHVVPTRFSSQMMDVSLPRGRTAASPGGPLRSSDEIAPPPGRGKIILGAEALETARRLAPGWDIHWLEAKFLDWANTLGSSCGFRRTRPSSAG
jgi:hypothetical protein